MPNAVFSGGRRMLATAVPPLLQHVRRLAVAASSDEQLLADFLARRSDEAFAALLGRHGPMVLNVCRRVLHDAHAAEDVFQATFLVLAGGAATRLESQHAAAAVGGRQTTARGAPPRSRRDAVGGPGGHPGRTDGRRPQRPAGGDSGRGRRTGGRRRLRPLLGLEWDPLLL